MAQSYQALAGGLARKIFAPMFRARWQNMQNIVNNTVFLSLIPAGYRTYYTAYIKPWLDWASGYVPQVHRYDFFSTGMGYTVCDIFARECMRGGYRFAGDNPVAREFLRLWDNDQLEDVFNRMFFYSNAGGNAILALTPNRGELYPEVYSIDRVVFMIGRKGTITQAMLLNRFIAGDTVYYAREFRVEHRGKFYYMVQLAQGTLATAPEWTSAPLKNIPIEIDAQWNNCYGEIMPNTWYHMPKRMRSLGLYNVRNKSVAVAIKDMPGYSDSTLHTALDVLYSIDYNYTQGQVDQYLGRGRAIVPKQFTNIARRIDQPGTLVDGKVFAEVIEEQSPLDNTFFTPVPGNNINGDEIKPTFMQPDLRGEAHKFIRDADLELLASKVGLSSSDLANHLTYNASKTATEVTAETDTTEVSVNNKRGLANKAINDMLADVLYFYGVEGDAAIEWGRATSNTQTENEQLIADYREGTLPLRDYLRKRWTDLGEDEIEDMARRAEQEFAERREQELNAPEVSYDSEQTIEQAGDSVGKRRNGNTSADQDGVF